MCYLTQKMTCPALANWEKLSHLTLGIFSHFKKWYNIILICQVNTELDKLSGSIAFTHKNLWRMGENRLKMNWRKVSFTDKYVCQKDF